MCYYSTSLPAYRVRGVEEGENLKLVQDRTGHHLPTASDGKIVCMVPGSEVHIASLQLSGCAPRGMKLDFAHLIGKPVSGRFVTHNMNGYAVDRFLIDDMDYYEVHLLYLAEGVEFYTGPKRSDVADRLGVNDPSITLDHMPPDPKPEGEDVPSTPAEPEKEPAPVGDAPALR